MRSDATEVIKRHVPELKFIPVAKLHKSGFNPKRRTDEVAEGDEFKGSKTMGKIAKDVYVSGVISPVLVALVNGRYVVGDGTRRVEAAKRAGIKEVPCAVYTTLTAGEIYVKQFLSRRPTGNEVLQVYLVEPQAIPERDRGQAENYEKIVGHDGFVELVVIHGATPYALRQATRIAGYVGDTSDAFKAKAARWYIIGKNALATNRWIGLGMDKGKLKRAILQGKNTERRSLVPTFV